jgi:hypothetical protein
MGLITDFWNDDTMFITWTKFACGFKEYDTIVPKLKLKYIPTSSEVCKSKMHWKSPYTINIKILI